MQRPYEQDFPLPAGSRRPAGAVNTAAAAAAVASAVVAAPPSVALNFRAELVERGWSSGDGRAGAAGLDHRRAGPKQKIYLCACINAQKYSQIQAR